MKVHLLALAFLLAMAVLLPARADASVDIRVAGNTVTAAIDIDGIEADLILTFSDTRNLTAENLGISAKRLGSLDLLALASRLPDPNLTSVPSALPLLITVEPPLAGDFGLSRTVRAEVYTRLLPYTAGSSFRLFKAPLGGVFQDITDEVAPGSIRTRGTTGGFSQFLVLADLRPTSLVIADKFTALRTRLGAVDPNLQAPLAAQLDTAEAAVAAGQFADAIAAVDLFRADVSAAAGDTIADAWSTGDRGNNVAGDLLGGAASLRFSIGYLRDFGL
jgi:hypothetical protein